MKAYKAILIVCGLLAMTACASLRPVSVNRVEPIDNYKYVYITPTQELTSSTGSVYNGYGSTKSKSINPSDVIAGSLLKRGYTCLPQLVPELLDKTLIVNYGESGRRGNELFGYTIEVTIQFVDASTHKIVCTCTGEGQGSTEADDIRIAINRCLDEVLK